MAASSSSSCKSRPAKEGEVCSSEEADLCACDTFCHDLQRNTVLEFNRPAHHRKGGIMATEFDARNFAPTRKAERERLRRDRLNEQLLELAGALEPDRPKNDKSTILDYAIQTIKGLMTDVERLRAEHTLLADESQDLSQEKKELMHEKSQLTSKVERLQCQVYQQMHAMLLWITADPTGVMGAGSFRYPVTSFPHGATDFDAGLQRPLAPGHPFVGQPQTNSYVPAPLVPGIHPALQAHYGYEGRGAPYFPYPFNFSNGPSQSEVPSAQVPHSVQRVSGYPLEVQSPSMYPMQLLLQAATYPQADGPGFTTILPSIPESHYAFDAGTTMDATMPSSRHTVQGPVSSSLDVCDNEQYANTPRHVETALRLQTPASLANAQLKWSQQAFGN